MYKNSLKISILMILAIIFSLILPQTAVFVEAGEPELIDLSYEKAIDLAIENTRNLQLMDKNINAAWDSYLELMEKAKLVQQQLDMINDYEKIYQKKQMGEKLDSLEQIQLSTYLVIYGPTPQKLSPKEIFENYIKPREFPSYSMGATVEKMRKQKLQLRSFMELEIRQVYDNILSLQESYALQNELYNIMQNQNEQMHAKYEKGIVSKIDMTASDSDLQKQKLRISKMERNIDNLMMSLKQKTGITLTQRISLHSYYNGIIYKAPESYEFYLEKALSSRYEVISSNLDLKVKQRELDILKEYNLNPLTTDRMEAQQAVDDKLITYKEAVGKITTDINFAYKDIIEKRADIEMAEKKMEKASRQYEITESFYNNGMVNSIALLNAKFTYTQAQIDHLSAIRTYNSSLYKFEMACGIGPGYFNTGGGY
ncbi:MAG: TolC family protein [Clostridiaceae bacterium]